MVTKTFEVYGANGHRQAMSFTPSVSWDFSEGSEVRILDIKNFDITGTHQYTLITITCNTEREVYEELEGQITDGYFENVRTGGYRELP